MKKIFLAVMLLVAVPSFIILDVQSVYARSGRGGTPIPASAVPRPVKKSFKQTFPDATQVEWEYTALYYGGVKYIASFKMNGQKWEASFSPDGILISSGPKA